jgi:hypothetical protein
MHQAGKPCQENPNHAAISRPTLLSSKRPDLAEMFERGPGVDQLGILFKGSGQSPFAYSWTVSDSCPSSTKEADSNARAIS